MRTTPGAIPTTRIRWLGAVRIVGARAGPVLELEGLTERDVQDFLAIEDAFSPAADVRRVSPSEWMTTRGASWVMPVFAQPSRHGSRLSDGTFGVFDASAEEETAIAETRFHWTRFHRAANTLPCLLRLRALRVSIAATYHDLRDGESTHPELYTTDPARYAAAERWGAQQRAGGADGIAYRSVRRQTGQCVALFRPRAIVSCDEESLIGYEWDGTGVTAVYRLVPIA